LILKIQSGHFSRQKWVITLHMNWIKGASKSCHVNIVGPVFEPTGYAQLTRKLALGLDAAGITVRISPIKWGDAPEGVDTATRIRLKRLIGTPIAQRITIHIGPPDLYRNPIAGYSILFAMLESDRIPAHWASICNCFYEVWVPTEFNKATFIAGGVHPGKIRIMPLGVDHRVFLPPPAGERPHHPFTFLSVFEWIPRKGYALLITAFANLINSLSAQTFMSVQTTQDAQSVQNVRNAQNAQNVGTAYKTGDVRLVLKVQKNAGYQSCRAEILAEIEALCAATGNAAAARQIEVISKILDEKEMASLYARSDCFVLPSSGEGWCFPIVEAAAAGLPVITTDWAGPATYLDKNNAYLIPVIGMIPASTGDRYQDFLYGGSQWAAPDPAMLERHMLEVCRNPGLALARANSQRKHILGNFSWECVILRITGHIKEIHRNLLGMRSGQA
jgi:glycosyltransferase involved in cell wall biosynthesis